MNIQNSLKEEHQLKISPTVDESFIKFNNKAKEYNSRLDLIFSYDNKFETFIEYTVEFAKFIEEYLKEMEGQYPYLDNL